MEFNIACTTCDYPSMISGSFVSGSSTVTGLMCSNPSCPEYFIPITGSE